MILEQTRTTIAQARAIGFTRRDLLKYGLLAASAATVAACGGQHPVAEVVEKFAVGTWRVRYQLTSNSRTSSSATPSVEVAVTVSSDGTFTTSGGTSDIPTSGSWAIGKNFVQITGDGGVNAIASNVPDTMSDTTITWQFDSDSASAANFTAPITWSSSSKTLTILGTDANRAQFPIEATKQ